MNKKIVIAILCLNFVFLRAQDYIIVNPLQLAVAHSTARLANAKFSGSALSQAFFRDNYDMNFTLYLPYNGLTDAKLRTSSFTLLTPSFNWGAVTFRYADFRAENFSEPVFDQQRIQLGYSNILFNKIVFSIQQKWSRYTWFSDAYDNLSVNGLFLDVDMIYILDGYNSLGFSLNNLIAPEFSSHNNDRPARELKLSYCHIPGEAIFDMEGGISVFEDYLSKTRVGGFLNSEIRFNNKFSLAAEYAHRFFNQLGVALTYSFSIDNIHTQLSYGFRIDDSPLPVSSLKQAFAININLNQWRTTKKRVNPQLLYRDEKGPQVRLERLGNYTVFINDDDSDFLQLKISAQDNLSGLESLKLEISPENDSSNVQYNLTRDLSGFSFTDTMRFAGYDNSGRFFDNGLYQLRIAATDNAGNMSVSPFLPFRVMSHRNDSLGPDINLEFDSSTVVINPAEKDFVLSAKITIDEQSDARLRWTIQLLKSSNDSTWTSLKPVSGTAEVYNHNFQWLLRKRRSKTIDGRYKLKIEAYDELNNYSLLWSAVKNIIDTVALQEVIADSRTEQQDTKPAEPAIIYIPDRREAAVAAESHNDDFRRIELNAAYNYKDREVTLTQFKFVAGRVMNINDNQQGLSVIGFYLQDLPNTQLIIEYPYILDKVPGFENDIRAFFKDGFAVDPQRVKIVKVAADRIYFKIWE